MQSFSSYISYKLTCLQCLKIGDWDYNFEILHDKEDYVLGVPNNEVDDEYFHNCVMKIYEKKPLACHFCGCVNRFSFSKMRIGETQVLRSKSKQRMIIEQGETVVIEFEKITHFTMALSTKQIQNESFFTKAFFAINKKQIKISQWDLEGKNILLFEGKISGIEFFVDGKIKEMHGLYRKDDDAIWERFLITTALSGFGQYKFTDRNNYLFQPETDSLSFEPINTIVFYLLRNIVSEGYQV